MEDIDYDEIDYCVMLENAIRERVQAVFRHLGTLETEARVRNIVKLYCDRPVEG